MSAILDVLTGYGKAQGIVVRQTFNRRSMMFPYIVCNDTDNRGHSTVVKLIRSILCGSLLSSIPEVDCYTGKKENDKTCRRNSVSGHASHCSLLLLNLCRIGMIDVSSKLL